MRYEIETETLEPEVDRPRPEETVPEVEVHGNEAVIRIVHREAGREPSERKVRLPNTTWG